MVTKTDLIEKNLSRECLVFSYYLIGEKPNEYIIEKYQHGHRSRSFVPKSPLDKILTKLAGLHPVFTRLSDVYSSNFYKGSILRQKLVLLLAILESSAPTYKYFDIDRVSSKPNFFARLVWVGVTFILMLFISAVLLVPLQIMTLITSSFSRNTGSY